MSWAGWVGVVDGWGQQGLRGVGLALALVTCAQGGEARRYLCVLRASTGRPTDWATKPTSSSILRSKVLPEKTRQGKRVMRGGLRFGVEKEC